MASSKGIQVRKDRFGQMRDMLTSLPEKEQEIAPIQQAIDEMLDQILAAFEKGYTVVELAPLIGESLGVEVSATTLSRCIREAKKKMPGYAEEKPRTKGKKTSTKAKKAARVSASTPTETEDASVQVAGESVATQSEGDAKPEPKKKLTALERLRMMSDDEYDAYDDDEEEKEPELVIRDNFSIMPKDEDL